MRVASRSAASLRSFRASPLRWLDPPGAQALAFTRGDLVCVANLGTEPVPLAGYREPLLSSGPLVGDGTLPPDRTAWLPLPARTS